MTGVLHSVSSSSFRSPRYRLRSFPGCFGPSISTLMCVLPLHALPGGMLYMHTNTGQVLCVLLWLPKDLLHRCSQPTRRSLDPSQSPLQSSTPPTGSHQKGDST